MRKTYSWHGKTLNIIGEKAHMYHFEKEVIELIDYGDIVVVMTDYGGGDEGFYYQNVFGVANGEIVWRIEDFHKICPLFGADSFGGIRDNDGETFIAIDGYGHRYIYNVQTGKIIRYLDWVK